MSNTLGPGWKELDSDTVPEDWSAAQLRDICSFQQGGKLGLTKESHYTSSGTPAYSAAGQDGFVEKTEFRDTSAVILSAIGANCGRCFLAEGDFTTLANIQVILPDQKNLKARFLHYRVDREGYWPRSGSAQPFIKPRDMKECWIAFPTTNQQSKIAEVLDTLDAAIRGTEAVVAKLKAMKQGLLHDLLTRGIDANGDLRPPHTEAPHLYKETPLGWLPKEWEVASINSIARSSAIGPFGSDLVASDYRDEGVPVVFVRDIKPDAFNWKSNVFLDERKALALNAHRVTPGDVVATKMGFPPCIAAVYPAEMEDGIITADVVCIRVNEKSMQANWLSISMNSPRVQRQVDQITAGVTRPKVTLRDVRELKIALPDLDEQTAILSRASALETQLKNELEMLEKLRLQKSGLMDDLLTGRVPVTPLLGGEAAHGA